MSRPRLIAVAAVAALLTVSGCTTGAGERTPVQAPDAAPDERVDDRPVEPHSLRVLHQWDVRRSAAYSRGDAAALRRLYSARSRAGERDVRRLRAYVERGLAVRGLRMQVLAVEVLPAARDRIRLRVRDRVASGLVVGAGLQVPLPRDRATTRVVTFERGRTGWVVRAVR